MERRLPAASIATTASTPAQGATSSVPPGNSHANARGETTVQDTTAKDVAPQLMELRCVLSQRAAHALTPLKAEAWKCLLSKSGLLN